MKYYVTIYIDQLFGEITKDFQILKLNFSDLDFTHAFLGLTRKHPNKLDSMKFERETNKQIWDFKLGKMIYIKEEYKWYDTTQTNEFNDGFWGFGTGTDSINNTAGKVFSNNHYIMDNDVKTNTYKIKKLRSERTFKNRCTLEVSKEQYEFLLDEIKKDFEATKDIRPQSLEPINEEFTYSIHSNNCVHWVIKKLLDIGIEIIDEDYTIPGNFMDCFSSIMSIHSIFLKFQSIDDNLKSITGAKAFRDWARTFIHHPCFHQLYIENNPSLKNMDLDQEQKDLILKVLFNVKEIYNILDIILQARLNKLKDEINIDKLKGDFEFIYWDKQENKIKSLKAENDYNPIAVENFDLNIPANNCSISKFYPFIFIPRDKILSRMLYHKYDYGKVSESYQKAANEFYLNVLAGIQSDKYWSKSYHKLSKINKQFQVQTKEIENV